MGIPNIFVFSSIPLIIFPLKLFLISGFVSSSYALQVLWFVIEIISNFLDSDFFYISLQVLVPSE